MKWVDEHIEVEPCSKPKKITGTRFASILGFNKWNTPFATWCEITKTYQEPFEDTKYTIAGKTIEPLQHEYMRKMYGMTNLVSPEDVYGQDFFKKTYGDFFPKVPRFGGMWDALLVDENGKPTTVIEFKTTSRADDWSKDIPDYYGLQASLYAELLGVEEVIMVASFLEDKDYVKPSEFVPNASNTIVLSFNVHERYKNFDLLMEKATRFWDYNVMKGISPDYTDKDAEIIKILKTTNLSPDTDIKALVNKASELKAIIDENKASMSNVEKEYKKATDLIKSYQIENFEEDADHSIIEGNNYTFQVDKSIRNSIDENALKRDGLYDKYVKQTVTYTLRIKEVK